MNWRAGERESLKTMTTRTVLAWIAEVAAWEAQGASHPATGTGRQPVPHENRTNHNPSPEEILAAIQEIQAGWSDRERLSRVVGRPRPKRWSIPHVRSADIGEPDA
jgi:hypothetical protein